MTEEKNPIVEAARVFIAHGFAPLPLPYKDKGPTLKKWPDFRTTPELLDRDFGGDPKNIGLILGEASGGLMDVDLDCPEAVSLAAALLPNTGMIFGRQSKLKSHYLFCVIAEHFPTMKFQDGDGNVLLELRGDKCQTMAPPSIHPNGEEVVWHINGEPVVLSYEELKSSVALIASACLAVRFYPEQGSREDYCMTWAGILARSGCEINRIEAFIESIAENAEDEEAQKRMKLAASAMARIEADRSLYGLPHLAEFMDAKSIDLIRKWLNVPKERDDDAPRQSDLVMKAVSSEIDLWQTEDGTAFASFKANGRNEHVAIESTRFKRHLMVMSQRKANRPYSKQSIEEAVFAFSSKALLAPVHTAFIRIAEHEGKVYLDLCNEAGDIIEIGPEGWHPVRDVPVRFIRPGGMKPLPIPRRGGSVAFLRRMLNVASKNDFILFVGALVAAFQPVGPYPILVLNGEQGTSKSTVAKVYRRLVDPHKVMSRAMPTNEDDLYVAASNNWMLNFDNVSGMKPEMSDALCRVATEGGFGKRSLYTNAEEFAASFCRPIVLNGIPQMVSRPDLMDRSIILTLPVIPEERRKAERALWADFEGKEAHILGALLDAVSAGLAGRDEVHLENMVRMADAAKFVTAAEKALPWKAGTFACLMRDNQQETMVELATNHPVSRALIRFMRTKQDPLEISAQALLDALNEQRGSSKEPSHWPQTPQHFSNTLRRLAPALRSANLNIELDAGREKVRNRKLIRLTYETPF